MKNKYNILPLNEFLRREYPDDDAWKAFFKLWLDARGYHYSSNETGIVDGARDAGIDAIALAPNELRHLQPIVIQSKYFNGKVPKLSLHRFLETVKLFRNGTNQQFEVWLQKHVRESLKPRYQNLWSKRKTIRFVLVTSGRLQKQTLKELKKLKVEIEDRRKIRSLHIDMAEGKSPRPDSFKIKYFGRALPIMKNEDHSLYVLSARLADFAKAYSIHEDNLFAGNVRLALEGDSSSGVKQGLRETIETAPEEFPYYHNGITVVCRKATFKGGQAVLEYPSIVNGAQTVTFIGRSLRRESLRSTKVLVKLVTVNDDEKFTRFETEIAISSNTQNKVSIADLSVVNPDLVSLERYFSSHGWFLQRKRGKYPPGTQKGRITKDELLQCFAALDNKTGPSTAKDKQKLYKYQSRRLFGLYAENMDHKKDALFIAQLNTLLKRSINSHRTVNSSKSGKKISLAKYPTFAVFCLALKKRSLWKRIRRHLGEEGINKKAASNVEIEKTMRMVLRSVLAYARLNSNKNELTAFFKNKDSMSKMVQLLSARLSRKLKRLEYLD